MGLYSSTIKKPKNKFLEEKNSSINPAQSVQQEPLRRKIIETDPTTNKEIVFAESPLGEVRGKPKEDLNIFQKFLALDQVPSNLDEFDQFGRSLAGTAGLGGLSMATKAVGGVGRVIEKTSGIEFLLDKMGQETTAGQTLLDFSQKIDEYKEKEFGSATYKPEDIKVKNIPKLITNPEFVLNSLTNMTQTGLAWAMGGMPVLTAIEGGSLLSERRAKALMQGEKEETTEEIMYSLGMGLFNAWLENMSFNVMTGVGKIPITDAMINKISNNILRNVTSWGSKVVFELGEEGLQESLPIIVAEALFQDRGSWKQAFSDAIKSAESAAVMALPAAGILSSIGTAQQNNYRNIQQQQQTQQIQQENQTLTNSRSMLMAEARDMQETGGFTLVENGKLVQPFVDSRSFDLGSKYAITLNNKEAGTRIENSLKKGEYTSVEDFANKAEQLFLKEAKKIAPEKVDAYKKVLEEAKENVDISDEAKARLKEETAKTVEENKQAEAEGETFYRGEGGEFQSLLQKGGEQKLGEGFYVTRDKSLAQKFAGEKGKKSEFKIKKDAKILEFKNETELENYKLEALKKFPESKDAGEALVKRAKQEGYQIIDGAEMTDQLAGTNIIDKSVLIQPTTQQVKSTKKEVSQPEAISKKTTDIKPPSDATGIVRIPEEDMKYVYKEAEKQGVANTMGKGMRKVLTENEISGLNASQQAVLRIGLESTAANENISEGAIVQNIQNLGGTAPQITRAEQQIPVMADRSEAKGISSDLVQEAQKTNDFAKFFEDNFGKPPTDKQLLEAGIPQSVIDQSKSDSIGGETSLEEIFDYLKKGKEESFVNVKGGKNKADAFNLSVKKLPNNKYGYAITMNTPAGSKEVDYVGKFATADKAKRMGIQRAVRMLETARQTGVPLAGLTKIRSALMKANKSLGEKALPTQRVKKAVKETQEKIAKQKAERAKRLAERDRRERKPGKKEIEEYQQHIQKFEHMELPEMVNIVKELTGKAPFLKKFRERQGGVTRGMFMPASARIAINRKIAANEKMVSETMAHEIGHLVDFLPEGTMNRGTLLGRVLTLRNFLKKSFGDLQDKTMRDELWALSQEWRPVGQNPSPSFLTYRKSSPELYADAISVMLNDPDLLQRTAPEFYKNFFKYLDRKPKVKQAFFDTWEIINKGEEALLSERQKNIYQMFQKGEEVFKIKREEKDEAKYSMAFKLKTELIDKNQIMIDKVNEAKRRGEAVSDETNPIYFLEEYNYLAGKVKAFVETEVQPILVKLQENGLTWENFGELMLLERASKERGKMANPGGFNKRTAKNQIEFLRNSIGNDKFELLKSQVRKFRQSSEVVLIEAEKAGIYTPEMMEQIHANDSYATFQVIDYLEDFVPASIKKQVGTYADIANPGTSTVMKMISIIRATETNKTKNSVVDFLKKHNPNEIKPAETVFDGRVQKPIEPKENDLGLFTVMEEGKVVGYYVDPYMVDMFDRNATQVNSKFIIPVLRTINQKLTRPLLIQYNPGFMTFNLVRDFWRFWKNLPDMGFIESIGRYKQALEPAMRRVMSQYDPLINEMEKSGVLSVTYNDLITGQDTLDTQIDAVIEKSGITQMTPEKKNKFLKPFLNILDFVDKTGQVIETLPKVAGYQYMKESNIFNEKEARSFVRTSIGSPDFFRKGAGYGWTNEVFLFSNAIKEAIRADASVMVNPKTRNGYWAKTAVSTFSPKLLMLAAAAGLFGEPLKEMFDNISEYDKTNYICVPLGIDKNGKTMYLRIPMDETGRFMGGLLWKAMTLKNNGIPIGSDVMELLAYTGGQLPSISPVLDTMVATGQYATGRNPYDFFRGRSIIPDREFQAGGKESFKPFVLWAMQNMGANVLLNFNVLEKTPTSKSFGEKTLELPVVSNVFNRFIRISDYGQIEKARNINDKVQKENSKRLIEWEKKINEAVKEYKKGEPSVANKTKIEKKLVKELLGERPDSRQVSYIRSKFQKTISKGYSDAKTKAVMSAYTNDAKVKVLESYKNSMSAVEFKNFLRDLNQQGIISDTVYNEF